MKGNPTPRRIVASGFGHQLRKLRGAQSRGAVVRALKRFGLTLDASTLLHYERGTVGAPDPAILWGLGRHYGLESLDELLTVLVMDRTGRRLRSGVDIAHPGLSPTQRHVAEQFGALDEPTQDALLTICDGLFGVAVAAPPRRRRA